MAGHRAWSCKGRVGQQAAPSLPRGARSEVEDDNIDTNEEEIIENIPILIIMKKLRL